MSHSGRPDLRSGLQEASSRGLFIILEQLYQDLPDTTCARRGACCTLLPPVSTVELAAWLHRLPDTPYKDRAAQARRLVEHFLVNAAQRRPCPWSRPDSCAIYPDRFMGCRAYGLWSPQAYEKRAAQAAQGQQAVAQAWKGLGVELPPEVLAPPPPYCLQVKSVGGPALDDAAIEALEERAIELSRDLPDSLERLHDFGGDISFAVASLALGQAQALSLKVAVTKALLIGDEAEAHELLAKAGTAAKRWAQSY
ncbi:MAG: YkgJ family cysteine cluster protein [Desulfarculaceae bacterium]|nr:YkgJ family cysteine cluster protein [Desulfarculaceae bacterium]MCF8047440.1 YkgJ family cysteine cluster protein [Desulfarculaceae bacterium]MCF8123853.1 YkgJ family cysteine cluster protein [Desulfarculaceae bacterium]